MSETDKSTSAASEKTRRFLSLDSWAVILALGLSLFVWLGWIKHVPW